MATKRGEMTSCQRVIAAIKRQDVDYVPFVGSFNPLAEQLRVGSRYQFPWGPSEREKCEYCIDELGIDPETVRDIIRKEGAFGGE